MTKNQGSLSELNNGSPPVVVHHRRFSKLPITIPGQRNGVDPEAVELKRLQDKWLKGTTPQGRDLVRKLVFTARSKLFESPAPAGSSAERVPTRPFRPEQVAKAEPIPENHSQAGANPAPRAKCPAEPPESAPEVSSNSGGGDRASKTPPSRPQVSDPQAPVPVRASLAATRSAARPETKPASSPTSAPGPGLSQTTVKLEGTGTPPASPVQGYSVAEARRRGLV